MNYLSILTDQTETHRWISMYPAEPPSCLHQKKSKKAILISPEIAMHHRKDIGEMLEQL